MPDWTLLLALILWAVIVVWAIVGAVRDERERDGYRSSHGRRMR